MGRTPGRQKKESSHRPKLQAKVLSKVPPISRSCRNQADSGRVIFNKAVVRQLAATFHCSVKELEMLSRRLPHDLKKATAKHPKQAYGVLRREFLEFRKSAFARSISGNDGTGFTAEETSEYTERKFKLIDLFSGAGGFTLGFVETGRFESIFANDFKFRRFRVLRG